MSDIIISVPITIHRPAPGKFDRRVEMRGLGSAALPCALGPDEIDIIPAGSAFEIEEKEGLAMVARFGGKVIK